MSDTPPPAPEPSDAASSSHDGELEPVGRDARFLVRLVLACTVAMGAAAFVGWKIRNAAAGCGAGMIRPGESVVPSDDAGR